MPVQWFTLRPVPAFPAVRFDGSNVDEVLQFAAEFGVQDGVMVADGVLSAVMADGEVQTVRPGWSLNIRSGCLTVTAKPIADDEWVPAAEPADF